MWRGEVDVACVFLPLAPGCPARRRRPAAAPPAPRARGRRRHRPRIAVDTAHANTQASLSPGPSLSEKASPACSHSARTRREKAKPQVDLFTPRPCPSTRTTRPAAPRRSTTTTATAAAIAPWSSCSRPTSECGGLRERGGVPRPTFFDRRAVFLSPRVSLGRGLVRALNRARADEGTTRTRLLPTLDRGPGGRDTARARAPAKNPSRRTAKPRTPPLTRCPAPNNPLSLSPHNRQWAASMVSEDPEFFDRLLHQQNPDYLWIGCSDSRVPVCAFPLWIRPTGRPTRAPRRARTRRTYAPSSVPHPPTPPPPNTHTTPNHPTNTKTGQPNPRPSPRRHLCPAQRRQPSDPHRHERHVVPRIRRGGP